MSKQMITLTWLQTASCKFASLVIHFYLCILCGSPDSSPMKSKVCSFEGNHLASPSKLLKKLSLQYHKYLALLAIFLCFFKRSILLAIGGKLTKSELYADSSPGRNITPPLCGGSRGSRAGQAFTLSPSLLSKARLLLHPTRFWPNKHTDLSF